MINLRFGYTLYTNSIQYTILYYTVHTIPGGQCTGLGKPFLYDDTEYYSDS